MNLRIFKQLFTLSSAYVNLKPINQSKQQKQRKLISKKHLENVFPFLLMQKAILPSVKNNITTTLLLQNHHHHLDGTSPQMGRGRGGNKNMEYNFKAELLTPAINGFMKGKYLIYLKFIK
jgi:hypothetical protein